MAEKYRRWSPYNYGVDNPIRFIDPDGMAPTVRIANLPQLGSRSPGDDGYATGDQDNHGGRSKSRDRDVVDFLNG